MFRPVYRARLDLDKPSRSMVARFFAKAEVGFRDWFWTAIAHLNTMDMMHLLVFFLLMINASLPAQEATPPTAQKPTPQSFAELYEQGISAYRAGNYEEAKEHFQSALDLQPDNASALTNLGLTFFKMEETGRAVAYFRKALNLDPGLETAEEALNFSYSQLPPQAQARSTDTWSWLTGDLVRRTPLSFLLFLTLISFFAAGWTTLKFLGSRRRAYQNETSLPPPPLVPSFLLLVLVVAVFLSLLKVWDQNQARATIVTEVIEVHSGPGEKYPSLFDLVEGSQVQIRLTQEGWVQVTDSKGLTGWVPASSLLVTSGPNS